MDEQELYEWNLRKAAMEDQALEELYSANYNYCLNVADDVLTGRISYREGKRRCHAIGWLNDLDGLIKHLVEESIKNAR